MRGGYAIYFRYDAVMHFEIEYVRNILNTLFRSKID